MSVESATKWANDQDAKTEHNQRAVRLRKDRATRAALIATWTNIQQYDDRREVQDQYCRGYVGMPLFDYECLVHEFDYLLNVPDDAFQVKA